MIFCSFGLQSRFAGWCDSVTARLVEYALGSVAVISANALEELGRAIIKTGAPHLVVCSRLPGAGLRAALAETNRRFVVALEDPRIALADTAFWHRVELEMAAQVVANSCAAISSHLSESGALVLSGLRDRQDPSSMAEAIARHFELPVSPADVARIVSVLADAGMTPERYGGGAEWWDGLDEAGRAVANGALEAYADHFAGGELGQITWGRELFVVGDQPNGRATRPVDVTGRARCLIYGPSIMLPPGAWTASVILGFSKEAAELDYVIEVAAGTNVSRTNLRPGTEGVFEARLAFSVPEATDYPIELRLSNERAAFDGRLALSHVVLAHQAATPTDKQYEVITALGL
jgi:hypothetical protein